MSRLNPTPRVTARTEARSEAKTVARAAKPPFIVREWRDAKGDVIVVARMKWRAMNRIRLEDAAGEPHEVFTEDLSDADVEWLEKVARSPAGMNFGRERLNAATSGD